MRPRIIVFEGLDRSGKDTLRKRFGQRTDERYVTLSRFLFSNAAYDVFFGRRDGPSTAHYLGAVEHMERELGMLTIFVDTAPEVCLTRAVEEGDEKYDLYDLRAQRNIFVTLIRTAGENKQRLFLLTEGKTVEQLVTDVVGWVQR